MHQANHVRIHVVFGTKDRTRSIADAVQPQLWRYIAGIGLNLGIEMNAIGGMEDHLHLLFLLPQALSVATGGAKDQGRVPHPERSEGWGSVMRAPPS